MKNSLRRARQNESSTSNKLAGIDVDLPDGADFDAKPPLVSFGDALILNEEYGELMADKSPTQEQRLREKCAVEFVL